MNNSSTDFPVAEGGVEADAGNVSISPESPIPCGTSSNGAVARMRPLWCNHGLADFVSSAVEAYSKELKDSPIRTKAITSCAISMLGELIGTYLKPRRPDGSRGNTIFIDNSSYLNMYLIGTRRVDLRVVIETVSVRRMAVFAGYGLVITGPFFHWWYGTLERGVSGMGFTNSYLNTLVKVAITQIVMTPPFLVFTLAYIKYFLSFDAHETVVMVKRTYAAALLTNWKVTLWDAYYNTVQAVRWMLGMGSQCVY